MSVFTFFDGFNFKRFKRAEKKRKPSCSSTFVEVDVYNTCLAKNKRHFVISSYHGNVS